MKYSFLWALYRQKKSSVVIYIALFLLPSLFDILSFFDKKYSFPFWYTHPQSTVGRMIESSSFWWMILFNLIPFFLLLFIHQKYLIKMLIIWACLSGIYFIINHWFIADYASSSASIIAFALIFLQTKNNQLMTTYIQSDP
ncbi:hypothetical protein ABCA12_2885 [Acinetobacter junii]|uniref:hypothetical protein n=1 Tax=Acinetobacter junii TaxID=40215 RepID=UPI00124FFDA7|nr:hypothetical protein [Acinetobacter junii]MDU2406758.1 hypothetical protein [Acinetobacter junii]QQV67425.1 hypothetical protein ABCA12_2885 [Acinetobacter junii]